MEGLGPCLAGNANGLKLLYIRADKGWRKNLDIAANHWTSARRQFRRAASQVGPNVDPLLARTAGLIWRSGGTAQEVRAIN